MRSHFNTIMFYCQVNNLDLAATGDIRVGRKQASAVGHAYMEVGAESSINYVGEQGGGITINATGEVKNYGQINMSSLIEGGTLTLENGSVTGDISLNSGEININGDATVGALTLNGGELNFAGNYTLDLDGKAVWLYDTVIHLNVDSVNELGGNYTLFENASDMSSGLDSVTIQLNDGTTLQTSYDYNSGSLTVTIPEPASATLSLLALAGLAARRRRASR